MTTIGKEIGLGILALVGLVITFILMTKCNSGTTTSSTTSNTSAPITVIKSDSTTIRQQELMIVQSQATIEALQDSLEKVTEKLTGVKPQYIIRYKDTFRVTNYEVKTITDSLVYQKYDSLLNSLSDLKNSAILVPAKFLDSGRYFKLKGTVNLKGVNVDDLEVYNSTSVVIGQKSTFLSTGPVVVNVVESNPLLSSDNLQTYQYVPKERKWTLVAGPAVIFNGTKFYQGVGLMAGYRIF